MGWKIYYEGGGTFDSENGNLKDAPARGVQVIVMGDPDVGWWMQEGSDYYIWQADRWVGVDLFGLFDFLIESGIVKFGRTITTAEYMEIRKRAMGDRDFARKTGYLRRERK